jgi:phage terminase small subunit
MTAPKAPSTLGKAGAGLWRRVVAEYEVGPGEAELLEAACIQWQRIHDAEALVAADGLVIDGARGRTAHPAIAVSRDASRLLAALVRHLRIELVEEVAVHRRGGAGRPTTSRRRRDQ